MLNTDKRHIMVDLETMGTENDAAIISIGAVEFGIDSISREFYRVVNLQSCMDIGLTVTPSTIQWWMDQSEEAKAVFHEEPSSIGLALEEFAGWVDCGLYDKRELCVWGNGAVFDNVILATAYRVLDLKKPWTYKGDMCYRTARAAYPHIEAADWDGNIPHNALHDATYQANHLIKIAKHALECEKAFRKIHFGL